MAMIVTVATPSTMITHYPQMFNLVKHLFSPFSKYLPNFAPADVSTP